MIQRLGRGFLSYKKLMELKDRREKFKIRSITKFQAIWRGHKARVLVDQRRLTYNYAATEIQKVSYLNPAVPKPTPSFDPTLLWKIWRGKEVRITMIRNQGIAIVAQSFVRRWRARRGWQSRIEERVAQMEVSATSNSDPTPDPTPDPNANDAHSHAHPHRDCRKYETRPWAKPPRSLSATTYSHMSYRLQRWLYTGHLESAT